MVPAYLYCDFVASDLIAAYSTIKLVVDLEERRYCVSDTMSSKGIVAEYSAQRLFLAYHDTISISEDGAYPVSIYAFEKAESTEKSDHSHAHECLVAIGKGVLDFKSASERRN